MKVLKALTSGFVGAVSLTALHQLLKKTIPDAPRVDLLGVKAIESTLDKLGIKKPDANTLYKSSLAGDIIFNSIYYSFTATGRTPLLSASLLGLGAGLGTISLPGPLGLGKEYSAKNTATQSMALGIYLFGGVAAAATYYLLNKEKE
jgi:hypothetical protein